MLALPEILLLGSLPLLTIASGFFSGCETALFSLSHHQQLRMARSTRRAETVVATLLGETRGLLITLLVTNTTVNVAYFVLSTVLLIRLREHYAISAGVLGVFSLAPVVGLILFGEVTPKLIASRTAITWSRLSSLPLMTVHRGLAPLRGLMDSVIITPLSRLISPQEKPANLSAQEMETFLELSHDRGVIDRHEERLLQEVLELSQLKVRQIMTPRVDTQAFDLDDDPADLISLIERTGRSHIPVYQGDLDHIVGVVHARQALLKRPGSKDELQLLIRQVAFVPELQRADQLLVQFRKSGTTLAIAVDEYGGTAGLVTLEDVVEEMVGQIAGPHEPQEERLVVPIGPGAWRVSAKLSIREWADTFQLADGFVGLAGPTQIHTIGGWMMAALGRLPREGDQVVLRNLMIRVDEMKGRRVRWLTINLQDPSRPQRATASPHQAEERP